MTIVKVYFDDWELTRYFHVRNITPYLQPSRNNVFQTHPDRDGAYFKKSTLGQATVEIKVSVRSNTLDTMDAINRMLNMKEPKKLFMDDRPDRYLMAILDSGSIPVSGRYYASTFTLKFISPNAYWNSNYGTQTISMGSSGRAIVGGHGTADSPIKVDVEFEDDCGHLAIVTPTSHISVGNPDEVDTVKVPPSEFALNEEMDSMAGWTKINSFADKKAYYPHNADIFNVTKAPKTSEWGLVPNPDWKTAGSPTWNGVAYKKDFLPGAAISVANNFKHKSRIDFEDLTTDRGAGFYATFTIYDENERMLMGMTLTDGNIDKNEITVHTWIGNGDVTGEHNYYTVRKETMPRVRGWIAMEKMGDTFTWKIHNDKPNTPAPPSAPPALKVGDIVQLSNSATTIYDWSGRALRLNNVIKGINLRVSAIRNSPKGKYQLTNVAKGWVEGFFELDAIQQKAAPVAKPTPAGPTASGFTVTKTYKDLAQKAAKGFFVSLATFSANPGYSAASINSVVVQRIHTQNLYDIPNTFMAGDRLSIEDGEILLNGSMFNGQVSYDSRPLYIEGGVPSEVALLPSQWATMPKAELTYESRWL